MKTKEKIIERLLEEKNITAEEAVILLKEQYFTQDFRKYGDPIDCTNDMVPYGEICSCNPKNGGSGICGCIMGNQLVGRRNYEGGNWITTGSNTTVNLNQEWSNK